MSFFNRTRGFLDLPGCLLIITFCGGMPHRRSGGRARLSFLMVIRPLGGLQASSCVIFLSVQEHSLGFWSQMFQAQTVPPLLHKSCLPRSLVPFTGEWCLETKMWVLDVSIGPGMSLYLATIGKESSCSAGDLIPGSGRSPGEGNGFTLLYSCLENSMDRGAWWATVQGITKNQTWLSDKHTIGDR